MIGNQTGTEAAQGRFTRDATNDINFRVRAVTSWDVRQQTEYGTLRTYIRFGVSNETPGGTGGGSTPSAFWDRAFMQFAGFTVGRSQSFFDLFTYGGAYSYHNVRVSGDTGASGRTSGPIPPSSATASPARSRWKTPRPARATAPST